MSEVTQLAEVEPQTWAQAILETKPRFIQMAPPHMDFEAEKSFVIALLTSKDDLMVAARSSPSSLQQAMVNIAAVGLSLSPAKKEAYLIARNFKVVVPGQPDRWEKRICLDISYMGFCNIATNTGSILWVHAECVYVKDTFIDNGIGLAPTHKREPFAQERGEFVGVFCSVKTFHKDFLTTIMPAKKVHDIRGRSEAFKKDYGPWITDFEEMAKKSVLRQGFKLWPKTDQFHRLEEAVHLSNENEGFVPIETSPEIRNFNPEQKEYYDELISKSDELRMFCFSKEIDEGIWEKLYRSFETGKKGQYQKIVDSLVESGRNKIDDYKLSFAEYLELDDNEGCIELLEDFPQEALDYILDHANSELATFIRGNGGLM